MMTNFEAFKIAFETTADIFVLGINASASNGNFTGALNWEEFR